MSGEKGVSRFGARALAGLLVLAAVAVGSARAQRPLTPVRARLSDQAIAADLQSMRDWERRLDAAAATEEPARAYTAAKARAWLAFARDEYQDNDRGTIVDDAYREATMRIAGLERGVAVVDGTTELPRAALRVRPALWESAARFRAHPGFARVSADVGRLEVALVRAGHGASPGASCLAAPFLRTADSLAAHIDSVLSAPPPAPVRPAITVPDVPVTAPPLAPPAAPPPPRDTDGDGVPDSRDCCPNSPIGARVDGTGCEPLPAENVPLVLDGVVFRSARSEVLPASRAILDRVAASLVARPDVMIEVAGHTDSRADSAYNVRLSAARAAAVRDYLVSRGVAGERIASRGYGEDRPRAENGSAEGRALNRRVELLWRRPARPGNRTACGAIAAPPDSFVLHLPTAAAPEPLVLEGVEFVTGSAVLTPESRTVLDRVAAGLVANPDVSLQVAGHTDNVGPPAANRALSLVRAQAVRDYLVTRGVAARRLEARGYGPDRPRDSNETPAGQANNRRVELRSLEQARAEDAAAAATPAVRAPAVPSAPPAAAPGAPAYLPPLPRSASPGCFNSDGSPGSGPCQVAVGIGDTIVIGGSEFQAGRLVLSARNRALLDGVANWMRRNPSADLRVFGHMDNGEGDGTAMSRSAVWANAVRIYLISRGVEPWRMSDYAAGADRPRAPNGTPEGRARNRRVEITRD